MNFPDMRGKKNDLRRHIGFDRYERPILDTILSGFCISYRCISFPMSLRIVEFCLICRMILKPENVEKSFS